MGTWTPAANALLEVARAAEVPSALEGEPATTIGSLVKRTGLVPGPRFAHDCALLAVHVESLGTIPPPSTSSLGLEGCVLVPRISLVLTYVQDCVPTGDLSATGTYTPPPDGEVEAWSERWFDQCNALWGAVADAVLGGVLDSAGCYDADVGEARLDGPQGAMAWCTIPVAVRLAS